MCSRSSRANTIPPLPQDDVGVAHTAKDKAGLLARHFASKMCMPDPDKPPPILPQSIKDKLQQITSEAEVRSTLTKLDKRKAVGLDNINSHLLSQ
ncbi:hypothetical protein E2C01_083960 [Portunus trituberculatus]|uniref:Uncharacterized protein n=1 Tax=Portunus trituberculatus TaxID=210409 RepID=A0A5B7IYM9_PORTR|nr:hypothetical protein [Portunus trituberculatus]